MSETAGQAASDDPVAAIRELGRAAAKTVTALAGAAGTDELTALDCVFALDEALDQLAGALPILPAIEELAGPGPRVAGRLFSRLTEINEAATRLAAMRKDVEALRDAEENLAALKAEHERLATRLAELEGISERSVILAGLRDRVAALESAVAAAAAEADQEELTIRLTTAIEQLKTLTSQQLGTLSGQIAGVITETASVGRALEQQRDHKAQLDAALAKSTSEAAEMTKAVKSDLATLAAWRKADAALAAGLDAVGSPEGDSVLERVRRVLDDLGKRMASVEEELGSAFEAYTSACEDALRIRPLSGPSS